MIYILIHQIHSTYYTVTMHACAHTHTHTHTHTVTYITEFVKEVLYVHM